MSIFNGTCTAMVTPFKNGNVDFSALAKMIDFQLENGINALLVCGTTGEPSTMSEDEQLRIISFAVKHVAGTVPVIAGIGGNNTAKVSNFSRDLSEIKLSALLAVTPYYNKATPEGLYHHYSEISKATVLPVIVYNVPGRTGVNITADILKQLSKIPNICAIKEASGNVAQALEMLRLCDNSVDIYSGNDDITVPMMSVGAKGVISVLSNVAPAQTVRMTQCALEGNFEEAAFLQRQFMPLIKSLFSQVNPIPVKAALSLMGLCKNELRLPLTPLTDSLHAELKQNMKALNLT